MYITATAADLSWREDAWGNTARAIAIGAVQDARELTRQKYGGFLDVAAEESDDDTEVNNCIHDEENFHDAIHAIYCEILYFRGVQFSWFSLVC